MEKKRLGKCPYCNEGNVIKTKRNMVHGGCLWWRLDMLEVHVKNTEIERVHERDVIIKEIFVHKNRVCMVIEMRFLLTPSIGTYCNGYVQTLPKNKGKSYDRFNRRIKTEELTFGGTYEWLPDMYFFGFDTVHSWNDIHPESKTFKNVKKKTIELCEEMVKKGI